MYVVARRTKYRISKRANDTVDLTTITSQTPHPGNKSTPAHGRTAANIHIESASLGATQMIQNKHASQPQTSDNNVSRNTPTTSLPDFSLQSYLNMAGGSNFRNPAVTNNPTKWGRHLYNIGILQACPQTNQPHRRQPIRRAPQHLTSTPLDPGLVPVKDLEVYWDHSGESLNHALPKNQNPELLALNAVDTREKIAKLSRNVPVANKPTPRPHPVTSQTRKEINHPDVTEDITISSLPSLNARRHLSQSADPADHSYGTLDTATTKGTGGVGTNTLIFKEGKADNVWRTVGNLIKIRTQETTTVLSRSARWRRSKTSRKRWKGGSTTIKTSLTTASIANSPDSEGKQ